MTNITKLFVDLEAILKPLEELDFEAAGRLRTAATRKSVDKILILDTAGIEVERITRGTL
jgi:hypothetical protein